MHRVGVLGGTFDPPHVAHLDLAEAARDQFGLERVLLVVAGDPWQKRGQVEAGARERLAMVEAAVGERPGIEVSTVEVDREGPSYTVDTLEGLAEPGTELFLILGADAAATLDTWRRPERVRQLAEILLADRPGAPASAANLADRLRADGWRCEVIEMAPHDVSSTELRTRLARGAPVGPDVPPGVVRVAEERGLYTRP
ncbi:MAG: nicotinate (nicotinamide) nucleotide adenylyltransferase [Actinobacteria bacterium]|nr:nicotinate (nicotinamide) nucleotide adenylyltransferase [Actinomycetota bacterium]